MCIRDSIECTDPDYLKVHMFALSDGQTGCITNSTCDLDVPAIFNGTIDCDAIVGVTFGGEQSICPGNQTDISVSADDGNSLVIVEFDEENPGGAGPIGEGDGEFILQQTNDNMSCDFELVILKAFTINPTSGCMGLADTLHLSFRPSLQVSLPTNLSVCLEDSVTVWDLDPSCDTGLSYQWEAGVQATDNLLNLPHTSGLSPGVYNLNVTITDADCPQVRTFTYNLEQCDVATHELSDATINIYPNPITEIINVEIEGDLDYLAILYSPEGKELIRKRNSKKILTDGIPSGIYLIEIRDLISNKRIIERLVKR